MESGILFPFTRNRYFFGKLLTQRDMEAEQSYINDKRRLWNAALLGPGVVCGLTVLRVDAASVAVEPGLALDGTGRELTLAKPLIVPLSELAGFEKDRGGLPYVYLCGEYSETLKEPMHALGNGALDGACFGRTEEGMRLYLRYGEPEPFEIAPSCPDGMTAEEWRSENLEKKLARLERVSLVLARIHVTRWDEAYEIGGIDILPFGQTVSPPVAAGTKPPPSPPPPPPTASPTPLEEESPRRLNASGTLRIALPSKCKPGMVVMSEDISHGLGAGAAAVALGQLTDNGAVFGGGGIFAETGDCEWAVKTNDQNGTFSVGIRLGANPSGGELRFRWTAFVSPCPPLSPAVSAAKARITVSPGVRKITLRETIQFTATVCGLGDDEVIWSVREQDGGSITRDGFYAAPGMEGVFTIRAASASNPDIVGSAFVVITPDVN